MNSDSSLMVSIEPTCLVSPSNKQANPELNLSKLLIDHNSKNKNKIVNDSNENSPYIIGSINSPKKK